MNEKWKWKRKKNESGNERKNWNRKKDETGNERKHWKCRCKKIKIVNETNMKIANENKLKWKLYEFWFSLQMKSGEKFWELKTENWNEMKTEMKKTKCINRKKWLELKVFFENQHEKRNSNKFVIIFKTKWDIDFEGIIKAIQINYIE